MKDLKKGLEESRSSIEEFKHSVADPYPSERVPPLPPTAYTRLAKPYAAAVIQSLEQHHTSAIAKGNNRE